MTKSTYRSKRDHQFHSSYEAHFTPHKTRKKKILPGTFQDRVRRGVTMLPNSLLTLLVLLSLSSSLLLSSAAPPTSEEDEPPGLIFVSRPATLPRAPPHLVPPHLTTTYPHLLLLLLPTSGSTVRQLIRHHRSVRGPGRHDHSHSVVPHRVPSDRR